MKRIIGLDIGGTKIEGIIVDENGKILNKIRIPTNAEEGKEAFIKNILSVSRQLWQEPLCGIGIGVPGPVNEDGIVTYMANIHKIKNLELAKIISKELKTDVKVENDANLFALAEHTFGIGKKYPNMMGVIVGTGIGSGVILNNMLYSGRHGGAGEIGHNIVDVKGLKDLEYFCAGPGILRLYIEAGGKSSIKTTQDIFNAKDETAKAVIEKVHELLAQSFASAINTLNVELIVIGGGVSNSLDFKKLNKYTSKFVFPPLKDTFKIQKYSLTDSAGSLGAAALFFK